MTTKDVLEILNDIKQEVRLRKAFEDALVDDDEKTVKIVMPTVETDNVIEVDFINKKRKTG